VSDGPVETSGLAAQMERVDTIRRLDGESIVWMDRFGERFIQTSPTAQAHAVYKDGAGNWIEKHENVIHTRTGLILRPGLSPEGGSDEAEADPGASPDPEFEPTRKRKKGEKGQGGGKGTPPPGGPADSPPGAPEWRDRAMRSEKGAWRPTAFNIRLILENVPDWSGVIAWDDFAQRIVARTNPPVAHASRGEWSDAHDTELRHWLAGKFGFEPRKTDIADAVLGVALANKFHPVIDYLDRLVWDGQPRLHSWLQTYVGAGAAGSDPGMSDTQRAALDRYLSLVGPWWCIQSVARVRKPGCKADNVLILEGGQGILKSTLLKMLYSSAWFSDTRIDIGSKDAMLSMQGVWCIELAELDALNKADMRTAKAYFSSAEDRFRLPYGHRLGRFPRQSVMAGTTNQREYLQDMTGNRRYWPVACGEIDLQGIEADRDQLWAEAQARFAQGERWWEETAEEKAIIGEQQQERVAGDVWETRIQAFLATRLRACPPDRRLALVVTMDSIMEQALGMVAKDMKRPEQTRVGVIVQALGWTNTRLRFGSERVHGYRPGYRALDAASNPTATMGNYDAPPF
jgi:putative DNA primase/helicase